MPKGQQNYELGKIEESYFLAVKIFAVQSNQDLLHRNLLQTIELKKWKILQYIIFEIFILNVHHLIYVLSA